MQEIAQAHVFPAAGVFRIKLIIAAFLPGHIGRDIGAAGGYADTGVKTDSLFQTAVQHTGGINAPEPSAHVHNGSFHGAFSFVLRNLCI